MIQISIGTQNAGKIAALEKTCLEYSILKDAVIEPHNVPSLVPDQPIWLEEIVSGAKNRAEWAYKWGEYALSFGLESGIFAVPYTKSGYLDTTCCAIYDGTNFHIGFSSCFEYPKKMIESILQHKKEISDIAVEMGFSEDKSFREWQGMIGVLTKNRISRIDYSVQAIQMALLQLENPEHY
jgi:inosine/xanthosine triphosphatase